MNARAHEVLQELSPQELEAQLDAGKVLLVDVREPHEYEAERIPGALLFPLSTFDAGKLPPDGDRRIVFQCGSGKRSANAAGQRLVAGAGCAAHLAGGIAAWKAVGLPLITLDPATGAPVRK
jgi:rhodanese-related sulfurtransferase